MRHDRCRPAGAASRLAGSFALTALLALGCGPPLEAGAPPAQASHGPAPDAVVVETIAAVPGVVGRITSHGSLVARRESPLGPEVGGRVAAIEVEIGDRVEAGAVLFRIEAAPYALALAQAQAGLDLARAELRQVAAERRRADALRTRAVIAEQQVERLATSLLVARARARQAESQRALAARDLGLTEVRAPFAGSVSERRLDEGTLVVPQTVVVVLQESAALEARVAISGTQLGRVREGDPARLFVESLPDPIDAEVGAISDAIDPETRTFLVRIPVANPAHALKAGAFLRAEILPSVRSEVLVVPRKAIRSEDGEAHVLLVREGRAEEAPVTLGLLGEDAVEVVGGLARGERVIVDATVAGLAPGCAVVERTPGLAAR